MSDRLAIGIDRIKCDGHGVCADLVPEMIELDDWGYPIIDPRPVPSSLEGHARRAIKECPKLALRLAPGAARSGRAGRGAAAAT
jgi:ferredoxin